MNAPLIVECAAICDRNDSKIVYSVPRPGRHHDVIRLANETRPPRELGEQGFLLSDGRFATRKAAYAVAVEAGQIEDGAGVAPQHGLFSEDLW